MNSLHTIRLPAFALAAAFTLAMLLGVDTLATADSAPQLHAATAQATAHS